MENLINITNLQTIHFPVFKIGIHEPQIDNGLVYYYAERERYEKSESVKTIKYTILDDRNIPHDTLSRRRLVLKNQAVPLAKLTNALYFLGDLIKLADRKTWFIDSLGSIFRYKKSNRARLTFHKIENLIPIPTGGVVVQCVDITTRFKALYPPKPDKTHVGVLTFQKNHILYGFYDQHYDSTWRMI